MRALLIVVYLYFCIAISHGLNPVSTLVKVQSPSEISHPFLTTHKDTVILIANPHNTIQINTHQVSHRGKFITIIPYNPATQSLDEGLLTLTGETVLFGGAVKTGEGELLLFGSSTQSLRFNGEELQKEGDDSGLFLLSIDLEHHTANPVFIPDSITDSALYFLSVKDENYLFVGSENQMSLIVTDGRTQKVIVLFETTPESVSSMSIIEATMEDSQLTIYGQVKFHNNSNTYSIAKTTKSIPGRVLSFRIKTTQDNLQDEKSWEVVEYTDKVFATNRDLMVVVQDDAYFVREEKIVNFGLENHYMFLERIHLKAIMTESGVIEEEEEGVVEEINHEEVTTGAEEEDTTEESDEEEHGTNQHGTNQPGTNQPGTKEPETKEPGTDEPETKEPGTDEPETKEPGTDEPETNEPGTDKPVTDEPGTNEPGTDEEATDEDSTKEEEGTEEEATKEEETKEEPDPEPKNIRHKTDTSSVNGWAVTALCFFILGGIGYMLWRNSRSSPEGVVGVLKNIGTQGKEWIQRKFTSDRTPQSSEEFASMKQKEFYA
eukprot:TRINITY_DN139_c0_g1_i2.p1 TRINITY_DN139_c0_g1~~TRINITY_DN139_c0_g1_i2.p1  ORF type:complete len:547 (+),score=161.49 TRINITY_DN139_c0_g1_i2:69-1709(+)